MIVSYNQIYIQFTLFYKMGATSASCIQVKCCSQAQNAFQLEPQNIKVKIPELYNNQSPGTSTSQVTEENKNCAFKLHKAQTNIFLDFSSMNEMTREGFIEKKTSDVKGIQKESENIPKKTQFHLQDCTILGMLGQGYFSKVLLIALKTNVENNSQKKMAVKAISKQKIVSAELEQCLKLEENILETSESHFIPKLYKKISDKENSYLIMEWAEGGDSFSFIKKNSKRKALFRQTGQDGIRFLLGCVILALEYLHNRGVLYIDLKPENVLIFADGYAKLTDFGLSLDLSEKKKANVKSGTTLYLSPEAVMGVQCGPQLDLWTLGILAYQLSNCAVPFSSQSRSSKTNFILRIKQFHEKRIWHNKNASKQFKDFVHSLLMPSPDLRLGAGGWREIKEHSFFKAHNFDWSGLENKQIVSPLLPVLVQKTPFKQLKDGKYVSSSI